MDIIAKMSIPDRKKRHLWPIATVRYLPPFLSWIGTSLVLLKTNGRTPGKHNKKFYFVCFLQDLFPKKERKGCDL